MSITIPDNVTNIGWGAFAGCESLTSVTLPDCIKDFGLIEKQDYGGVSMNIVHISSDIFLGCTSLSEIKVKGKTQAEAEALLAGSLKATTSSSVLCPALRPTTARGTTGST